MSNSARTNILFFFTDDQRLNTIRALGNDAIHTPNMDRLVERGTTFTHAHIPSGTSGAVCMPSRAMLHTGRSLFHLDGAGQRIPSDHHTLGETLRKSGYETFGTGKWHNGRDGYHRSFSQGDEILFGGMADHWNVPFYHYDPAGRYETVLPEILDPQRSNEVNLRECDHIHAGRHSSEIICDAAIRFLEEHDADTPFFTYISFLAPHDPRSMPKEYLEMYDPDDMELPLNFMGGHPFDNGHLHGRDESLVGFPRDPAVTRRHIAEYYGMISHLDAQIGRVLEALERSGQAKNTIIVFACDNGLALGQHGLFGKQSCYEHSVRVPLIFCGPGIPEGARSEANAYLFDIFPTLCDLVGVETPQSVEGMSLVEAINGSDAVLRDALYFAFRHCQRAVKRDRYKLIEYVVDQSHNMTQLFDLQNDPLEMNNLAFHPEYADTLAALREDLVRLSKEWDDRESQLGKVFWPVYDASVGALAE